MSMHWGEAMWVLREKAAVCKLGSRSSPDIESADNFTMDFTASRIVRNIFLLFKSMIVIADQDSPLVRFHVSFLISWEGVSAFWCSKNINHSDQSTDFKLWTQMPPVQKYILFCNVTLSFLPSRAELISSLLESDLALYWLWSIMQHKWLYIIWF